MAWYFLLLMHEMKVMMKEILKILLLKLEIFFKYNFCQHKKFCVPHVSKKYHGNHHLSFLLTDSSSLHLFKSEIF